MLRKMFIGLTLAIIATPNTVSADGDPQILIPSGRLTAIREIASNRSFEVVAQEARVESGGIEGGCTIIRALDGSRHTLVGRQVRALQPGYRILIDGYVARDVPNICMVGRVVVGESVRVIIDW